MIDPMPWTSRTWTFVLPAGAFPSVLERLRGTAPRAAALVAGVPDIILSTRVDHGWSAKEHVGHLDDLHELDERRLDEYLAHVDVLTAADMTNRRTHTADHNAAPIDAIVARLRDRRDALVSRLEQLDAAAIEATAVHPRLGQRLRLIDWAYFVAEHDDHHLVQARLALRAARSSSKG